MVQRPSTFDSFDNGTGVQSNARIYINHNKRLDVMKLCKCYFDCTVLDCSKWPLCNLESQLRGTFPDNICDIWKHISSFYPSATSKVTVYFQTHLLHWSCPPHIYAYLEAQGSESLSFWMPSARRAKFVKPRTVIQKISYQTTWSSLI